MEPFIVRRNQAHDSLEKKIDNKNAGFELGFDYFGSIFEAHFSFQRVVKP